MLLSHWIFRSFQVADAELLGAWLAAAGLGAPPWVASQTWAERMVSDPRISCRAAIRRAVEGPVVEPAHGAVDAGGEIVGFCRLDIAPDRSAELTLVVAPTRRRAGVGSALLEDALDQARELGLRRLTALVQTDNDPGFRFFASSGFEETAPPVPGFIHFCRLVHRSQSVRPLEIRP